MLGRIRELLMPAVVVVGLVLGASEGYAARSSILGDPCEDCNELNWNWCAPSVGGQQTCDFCCAACGVSETGTCVNSEETEFQGCHCNGQ
jgi:hypothetical protein